VEQADAQTDPKVKKTIFGACAALAVIGAQLRVGALRHF
jgi:chemotaxis receptor (MCP) glutamine deamidase CheD